jgi:hypothetical protein
MLGFVAPAVWRLKELRGVAVFSALGHSQKVSQRRLGP